MRKIVILFFILLGTVGFAQQDAWVYFVDKPNADYFLDNPLEMLSQRALDRRAVQNIALDLVDVPISETYISQIAIQSGITVLAQSKWMNCLHVRGSQSAIEALSQFSFVSAIQFANPNLNASGRIGQPKSSLKVTKEFEVQTTFLYGNSSNQIQMLGGNLLHQANFTGVGKIIAVMDNGFSGVNTTAPFQRVRDNNQILGGYDFVNRDDDVYEGGSHGTVVFSTMGGFKEGELVGTAPDAAFYLFKTEASGYENPVEESFWVEAAELADSLGVDIISTSLGYSTFDNAAYNYTYADMNGVSTFSARGADLAFSRGMICVTSAGNYGNGSWQYITTPADAIHTLTVGAVNSAGNYASFSSIGPSFDGRIKPDVVAQGVSSTVATSSGAISSSNGTSFSAPIVSGLVACLWQALPEKTNAELLQLIRESAHLYQNPTAQLGYGIPNFNEAYTSTLNLPIFDEFNTTVYPNPFTAVIKIQLSQFSKNASLAIFTVTGQKIKTFPIENQSEFDLSDLSAGLYLYEITTASQKMNGKLVKK